MQSLPHTNQGPHSVVGRVEKRGFTLTEIAIVLGVIGTILGAIWVAASAVNNNQKLNKAASELMAISSSIRALYAAKPYFPSATETDITCTLVNFGVFPQDMITSACVFNNYATYPMNPWGGATAVYASTSAPDASTTQFEILFRIPPASVQRLVAIMAGVAQSAGITYLLDGDGSGWFAAPNLTPETVPVSTDDQFSSDWKLGG